MTLQDQLELRCGQTLPNRMMRSALSEALCGDDHGPSRRLERAYDRWSAGGFGLVITGNVMVDRRHIGEPGNVVVEDDRHQAGLRRWAATFAHVATPLWVQINHPGRQASALASRRRPVAPSAVAAKIPGAVTPRALHDSEIREIIDRFARTAAVLEAAGFDGVEVHGAHGYLVTQFLSPLANQRDDHWGGDPRRRRRFLLEIIRAIRGSVSPSFAVGVKLNSADFQRGGFTEDESRDVIRALADESIDLLEISGGSYEAPAMLGQSSQRTQDREAYFLEYAHTVRDLAGDLPIAVTGGFRSGSAMRGAIGSGDCDIVGLGRSACLVPDAAEAILTGRTDRLEVARTQFGLRRALGAVTDLAPLDNALDMQWYTDQMHRLGAGKDPDPHRPWWRTAASMSLRNGPGAFTPKRS
nr:NADH:flavin oxidoreductase/NADH oxidase family protein [Nocardia neocaledoniensis]